jgi:hypothetical protein
MEDFFHLLNLLLMDLKKISPCLQKAVIIYENNTEDLILQVKYEGEVENFAWVVPLPNRPIINVSQPELFFELFSLTVPTRVS